MKELIQKFTMPENCYECHLFNIGKESTDGGWREIQLGAGRFSSEVVKKQFDPNMFVGVCCHIFGKTMTQKDVQNRAWKPRSNESCDYKVLIKEEWSTPVVSSNPE